MKNFDIHGSHIRKPLCSFCLLLFSFVFVSCGSGTEPLSKQEAMEIAQKIDSSILYKHPRLFDQLIDETVFSGKVSKVLNTKNSSGILQGIREGLKRVGLGDRIIESLGDDGHYEMVKHYEKDGIHHLVYRLYSDDGLNYHDIELCKRKGKTGIADIFVYITGENLSNTISQLANSFVEFEGKTRNNSKQVVEAINRIREYSGSGEYQKALRFYEKLPKNIQDQRTVKVIYLQVCREADTEKYRTGLEQFRNQFPNDPNIDLLMIDAYIMDNDFDNALACINRLDSFINKDPFLDFYRALICNMGQKSKDARLYLESLYQNYPDFGTGVIELIANYIDDGMHDKANQLIREYRKQEKFDQDLLDGYLFTKPFFKEEKTIQ